MTKKRMAALLIGVIICTLPGKAAFALADDRPRSSALEELLQLSGKETLDEITLPAIPVPKLAPGIGYLYYAGPTVGKRNCPNAVNSPAALAELRKAQRSQVGNPPVLLQEQSRQCYLLLDLPARFPITDYAPGEKTAAQALAGYRARLRPTHDRARRAVKRHDKAIARISRRLGMDADLARAIMYMENAVGGRNRPLVESVLSRINLVKSYLPMNIRKDVWGVLISGNPDFQDPETNIEASLILLTRIAQHIENPSIEKVASIYNFTGREQVSGYGLMVAWIYENKVWESTGNVAYARSPQPGKS